MYVRDCTDVQLLMAGLNSCSWRAITATHGVPLQVLTTYLTAQRTVLQLRTRLQIYSLYRPYIHVALGVSQKLKMLFYSSKCCFTPQRMALQFRTSLYS